MFFIFLGMGVVFGVRESFEWDGEAILFGARFLDLAKAGEINLYRYPWQPLTYELLGLLLRLPNGYAIAYALPAFTGACSLALLASPCATWPAAARECSPPWPFCS